MLSVASAHAAASIHRCRQLSRAVRARGAGAVGSMQQVYAWLLQTFCLVGGVPSLLAYDDAQEWQLAQVAAARNAAE